MYTVEYSGVHYNIDRPNPKRAPCAAASTRGVSGPGGEGLVGGHYIDGEYTGLRNNCETSGSSTTAIDDDNRSVRPEREPDDNRKRRGNKESGRWHAYCPPTV